MKNKMLGKKKFIGFLALFLIIFIAFIYYKNTSSYSQFIEEKDKQVKRTEWKNSILESIKKNDFAQTDKKSLYEQVISLITKEEFYHLYSFCILNI